MFEIFQKDVLRQFQPVKKRHGLAALCIEPLFKFAPIGTGICAAGQDGANIHHGKPPFLVVPDTANGGFLEHSDVAANRATSLPSA